MARARKQRQRKGWSYSAGERGRNRVRVFEHDTGRLMLEWYEPAPGSPRPKRKKRKTLGHSDRARAKQQADEVAAAFAKSEAPPTQQLTLQRLFDNYLAEVTPRRANGSANTITAVLRCSSASLDRTASRTRSPSAIGTASSKGGGAGHCGQRIAGWSGQLGNSQSGTICSGCGRF